MDEYILKTAAMEIVRRTSGDYAAAFAAIRKLPAADVAPVVHGCAVLRETVGLLEKQERQIQTLKAYEDTELRPGKVSWMKEVFEIAFGNDTSRIERVHNLHVADKEGRVVVLPCKVGDTIYAITQVFGGDGVYHKITEKKITGICGNTMNKVLMVNRENSLEDRFSPSEFGRTVFLTREEAEKALAEMEGKKDG